MSAPALLSLLFFFIFCGGVDFGEQYTGTGGYRAGGIVCCVSHALCVHYIKRPPSVRRVNPVCRAHAPHWQQRGGVGDNAQQCARVDPAGLIALVQRPDSALCVLYARRPPKYHLNHRVKKLRDGENSKGAGGCKRGHCGCGSRRRTSSRRGVVRATTRARLW